mmetsp:Transcript_37778/g.68854  ORF Transcript_37778/g.68854 Transcript_37778/m.68854 type:complete len:273 (+) Transcript_37778:86-904(+)
MAMPAGTAARSVIDPAQLLEETPKVEAALKTFMSLRVAQTQVTSVGGASPDTGSLAALNSDLGLARVFLQTFNGPLPPVEDIQQVSDSSMPAASSTEAFQGVQEAEDPCRRAEFDLAGYRVAQMVWDRLLKAGHKPAKVLGKSCLRYTYPAIAVKLMGDDSALSASAQRAKTSTDEFRKFLADFGATVFQLEGRGGSQESAGDASLVWATDLYGAVAARHDARKVEASERAKRATSNEAFSEELRAAMQANPGSQPLIEELPDSEDDGEDGR